VTNLGDASKTWDAICIIDASDNDLITSQISEIKKYDESVVSEVSCFKCPGYDCRIIYSPMGELSDFDDVRAYAEAAKKCIKRALKAGAKAPVLCLPKTSRYQHADLVALLGALQELYVVSVESLMKFGKKLVICFFVVALTAHPVPRRRANQETTFRPNRCAPLERCSFIRNFECRSIL
jgi:hypothetical protein